MNSHFLNLRRLLNAISHRAFFSFLLPSGAMLVAGCGGSNSLTPPTPGNATVTVVATSTANDQLSQFQLDFKTIILTSRSGKTQSLLPAPEQIEFMHLNGTAEPLFTVNLPQDTYVSATAVIGPADYVCESGNSAGTETTAALFYGYTPDSHVHVNIPVPIEVTGSNMVLSLNLLVSQSASWTSEACTNSENPLITPTLDLAPAVSSYRDAMVALAGVVASENASGNSLSVTAADASGQGVNVDGSIEKYAAPSWKVSTNGATVFQGVAGLSSLTADMPVEVDAVLQQDGSLIASRVAVGDTDTGNLTVFIGPLLVIRSDNPVVYAEETEEEGYLPNHLRGDYLGGTGFDYETARFQVSGALSNVQQLPFPAEFGSGSMADGQNVFITTHQTSPPDFNLGLSVTTVTLIPQTINGTVVGISSESGFDTYTVLLAGYDLFPQLAVQRYQTTLLTDPGTVIVYADSNTKLLNTQPIAVGSTARFNGAVFNDNGTLRMDCLQINDGVPE
jgi:hypothetical protein